MGLYSPGWSLVEWYQPPFSRLLFHSVAPPRSAIPSASAITRFRRDYAGQPARRGEGETHCPRLGRRREGGILPLRIGTQECLSLKLLHLRMEFLSFQLFQLIRVASHGEIQELERFLSLAFRNGFR